MQLTSLGFEPNELIPPKYTCDGQDISPSLAWQNVPETAQSLALICDDPDAPRGTFVHWVVYNLPASLTTLPEAVPHGPSLEQGGLQGKNDFGKIGYGGPCPPGGTHRYYFTLYALDQPLTLEPGVTKQQVLQAIAGHQLAKAQLMGRYRRLKR
jgi:Raf kinase inhibitor-like YbhB/YbcL family protein